MKMEAVCPSETFVYTFLIFVPVTYSGSPSNLQLISPCIKAVTKEKQRPQKSELSLPYSSIHGNEKLNRLEN
jgi:hypothetical protein